MARKSTSKAASKSATPEFVGSERIVVLHGKEELLKREYAQQLRAALQQSHGDVDQTDFDGEQCQLADILDELRTFSMMQTYKLVTVDNAENFVSTHREALERYAQNPVDHATLLLRADGWRKGKVDKLIDKVGFVHKCEPLPTRSLGPWVARRAAEVHKVKLENAAQGRLIERLGHDMMRLDTELAKLAVLASDTGVITGELVDQVVGRSSDEQAWAVQEVFLDALANARRSGAAVEKLHELRDIAGHHEVLLSFVLGGLASKLYVGAQLKQQGVSPFQVAKDMRMWGPSLDLFKTILGRLDTDGAGRILDAYMDCNVRARTGLGDTMRNLECFCLTMADNLR